MYKVILWTKEQLIVNDDKVESIAEAMRKGKPFWLNHKGGKDFISASAISRITRATTLDYSGIESNVTKAIDSGNNSELRARIEAAKLKSSIPKRELIEGEKNEQETV